MLFFFGAGLKGMVANGGQLAASIGTLVVLVQQELPVLLAGGIGLLALFGAIATLRYWFFRFALEADRVRIRQGVLKKVELNVQFDRIQGVQVEQSLVFRLLGLVTVGFDTAGSGQQEGQLPAVTPDFAATLRERVEQQRKARAPSAATEDAPRVHAGEDAGECVVALAAGDMVRIGLTDRSVLAGLVAVPLLAQAFDDAFKEWFEALFQHAATAFASLGPLASGLLVVALLALCLLAVCALSIASAFLRYHDFKLFASGRRFRSTRGLFTRKETAVEQAKIQQLRLYQSVLMRKFERFRLRALPVSGRVASAEAPAAADTTLHVPLLGPTAVGRVAARVFGAQGGGLSLLPEIDAFVGISPAYIQARIKVFGLVPALVALGALYPFFGALGLWCLAWPPLVGLVAWQLWRRRGYMHTDHGLAYRAGFFGFTVDAFLLHKVQAVLLFQSPLQRRRSLATLDIVLASGVVSVPYIDHATACGLRDYMLYKTQVGRESWY